MDSDSWLTSWLTSRSASWSMFVVTCRASMAEIVSDTLWGLGVVAIEERTAGDGLVELWTSVGADSLNIGDALVEIEGVTGLRLEEVPRTVADTWREFAECIPVTDEVRIVPAWIDTEPQQGDVLIDPADTFGLGNHPTTIGALRLLLGVDVREPTLLDVGTGSGVLAIAMSKLRNARCAATDISTSSREVLARNCLLNHVHVDFVRGLGEVHERFDVVVANILAPVLREIAEKLVSVTRPSGVIVLAGMREDQAESVLTHYRGCVIRQSIVIDGWIAVALQNRDA